MKQLILLRHAKASKNKEYNVDFERPLKRRGIEDTKLIAKFLLTQKAEPDYILYSPSLRTLQTYTVLIKKTNWQKIKATENHKLYDATLDDLVEVLKSTDNSINRVLVVAHNPSMLQLCNLLDKKFKLEKLPTAALVAFSINISSWKNLEYGKASFMYSQTPKILKKKEFEMRPQH